MKVFLEFPLLKREFVGLLRTRRAFWLTLFLVALASLLPLLTWPTGTAGLSSQNREVFLIFAMTQLIAALLILCLWILPWFWETAVRWVPAGDLGLATSALGDGLAPPPIPATSWVGFALAVALGLALAHRGLRDWRGAS